MSVQLRVTPSIPAAARTIVAATGVWLLSLGVCAAAASPPVADALKLSRPKGPWTSTGRRPTK